MTTTPQTPPPSGASPVEQIPPVGAIRQRLADLAHERSLLRHLLRLAVRRERALAAGRTEGEVLDA
jgi:hypothetical protein